jgi:hypothetical protein
VSCLYANAGNAASEHFILSLINAIALLADGIAQQNKAAHVN